MFEAGFPLKARAVNLAYKVMPAAPSLAEMLM